MRTCILSTTPPRRALRLTSMLALVVGTILCPPRSQAAFLEVGTTLPGVSECALAWADFDNDGDQDLVLAGNTGAGLIANVYRNSGGGNPTFVDVFAGIPGVHFGAVAWADYDGDNDLDLLIAGSSGAGYIARIYRNGGGANPTFSDAGVGLPGVNGAAASWGDYDDDGDLDLALSGDTGAGLVTRVYRNSGGANPTFADIAAGVPGSAQGSLAWGDYDADGDLDLLVAGGVTGGRISRVYRSSGGANPTFSDAALGLPGVSASAATWIDYDQDNDLDLLLSGHDGTAPITRMYRSSGGVNPSYSDAGLGLPAVHLGALAFGDLDGDLDPDLLISGDTGAGYVTQILRNGGGANPAFESIALGLPGVFLSAVAWHDYDKDGDQDLAISGGTGASRITRIYRNNGGAYPPFTDLAAGLAGIAESAASWGDYDNDGDLDVAITGDLGGGRVARIYRSSGGPAPTYVDIGAGLTGVRAAAIAWGDHDRDGDLDLLVAGDSNAGAVTTLYRNGGGPDPSFADAEAGLPGVASGSAAWGDCDGDGDLDLLLAGETESGRIGRIYRNGGGPDPTFTDLAAGLPGVFESAADWGDYDRDGDLDLLLVGAMTTSRIARIYRNNGAANPTFTDAALPLPGVAQGAVAFADYDHDGDLDLVLAGNTGAGYIARIYRNGGTANPTFVISNVSLPGVRFCAVAWGDYESDGDLDLVLSGHDGVGAQTRLYVNDGTLNPAMPEITTNLPAVVFGSLAWGDADGDGDLDLLITGDTGVGRLAQILRNDGVPANTPPGAPGGLATLLAYPNVTMSWTAATDAQTPPAGLSYNLRVGSTPGSLDILSPMASLATGQRRIARFGSFQGLAWTRPLASVHENQYWSVQAVDAVLAGGPFAAEQQLVLAAAISGATDVPSDQGGWLYLAFTPSSFDDPGASPAVTTYGVWRRVPGTSTPFVAAGTDADAAFPLGDWALVTSVPALQQASYLAAVPTTSNGTPNDFLITASTTTPSIWFASGVATGQSLDNLAPASPAAFGGTYSAGAAHLTWSANAENDLGGYRLYRGATADFVPAPVNLVATVVGTQYDDGAAAPGDHFKLAAFDVNGNSSTFALVQVGADVGVETEMPRELALARVTPNPSADGRLSITFALPLAERARLSLVDLSGRTIEEHDVSALGAGWHTVALAEGRRLAPGLYWVRLVQGSRSRTTRVTVLGG